jgi:hypothetical protein
MTNKISIAWTPIFGSGNRLTIVAGAQSVNSDTTKRILECQNTFQYVQAVGIAPYFTATNINN